eukprot:TRINITY_DN85_c0_g5_i1.p1 TRINITY_DN85_c0_g5~~TRINITY_DN85_c0_g5_i1.p1  ORF type:complete len:310 (+),score=79.88 TRINITY_DN85_c0_g5_i1:50-979(+)
MVTGVVFKVMILFQIATLVVAQQLPLGEAPADVDPDAAATAIPTDSPLTPLIPTAVPVGMEEVALKNAVQNTLDGDIPQETRTILEAGLGGSKEDMMAAIRLSLRLGGLTPAQEADLKNALAASEVEATAPPSNSGDDDFPWWGIVVPFLLLIICMCILIGYLFHKKKQSSKKALMNQKLADAASPLPAYPEKGFYDRGSIEVSIPSDDDVAVPFPKKPMRSSNLSAPSRSYSQRSPGRAYSASSAPTTQYSPSVGRSSALDRLRPLPEDDSSASILGGYTQSPQPYVAFPNPRETRVGSVAYSDRIEI